MILISFFSKLYMKHQNSNSIFTNYIYTNNKTSIFQFQSLPCVVFYPVDLYSEIKSRKHDNYVNVQSYPLLGKDFSQLFIIFRSNISIV